jgi:hypothetical protein
MFFKKNSNKIQLTSKQHIIDKIESVNEEIPATKRK